VVAKGRQYQPDHMPIQEALAKGHMPMWMTPGEIKTHLNLLDSGAGKTYRDVTEPKSPEHVELDNQTMARKLDNAGTTGVRDSVAKQGVQKPLEVFHDGKAVTLMNGHHRLASSAQHRPNDLIPVTHSFMRYDWTPRIGQPKPASLLSPIKTTTI